LLLEIQLPAILKPMIPFALLALVACVGISKADPAGRPCGLLGLMLLYTIPAGNSGAMRSAQPQLGILYFGLIGSTLIVLYMLISSAGQMRPQGAFAVTILASCCAGVGQTVMDLRYRRSLGFAQTDWVMEPG
jgi:hypothetical protein